MWKTRITALLIILIGFGIGYFIYKSEPRLSGATHPDRVNSEGDTRPSFWNKPFRLGLDLSGGTQLTYRADVSALPEGNVEESMEALRDVIERRVNLFGVSEPVVQVEEAGFSNQGESRLIVDLPGVTDIDEAVSMIGQTPFLEFRVENTEGAQVVVNEDGEATLDLSTQFVPTDLTGKYLDRAVLEFDPNTAQPMVSLIFDDEGAKLFEQITRENTGKIVAIFLDDAPISTPVVQEAITGGKAVISGNFTPKEAKELVGRLNSGALPVPIELISTRSVGASLGAQAVEHGIFAALIGALLVATFLILWYRLPGLIAVLALSLYVVIILAIFKLVPVTLTAAGIAGFIISIGIAVDANILIFERIKEEMRTGKTIPDAIKAGFERAWLSIRDSNTSSVITGLILFWFGTSLIKGFALTLVIGVITSLISALFITRIFLFALRINRSTKFTRFLFGSGFSNANQIAGSQ